LEKMNADRDLISGIALSLLVHGAFLGLPFSPGNQRPTLTHQSIPLEISLVKLKGHDDARPKMKLVPLSQPQRVRQGLSISRTKVTKRREKSPVDLGRKPIPVLREKPITPLKEKTLTPTPELLSAAPQRQIEDNAPQPGGEMNEKAPLASPLPSAETPIKGKDFEASLIPKGGDSSRSRFITLARPRYDRNPKPSYPRIARRRGYEGVVVLKVEILPSGRVGQLRVKRSSGHHILDRSALKTVKQWRFIPAKRGEDPIRIWAEIPIKFELK
jgi:protein TonB